ncbi:MAG TPA: histidine phosphatase family protein [Gaiellaceae bacterium]|nr:histidine phosphatase family protein [Gaiellaceae bacterium]
MIVYLVRHARAGHRESWEGDDRLRPLDERGQRQAQGLVAQLADRDFSRILSSPYIRCVQSVEPLAAARGLDVEAVAALAEGAGEAAALELFHSLEAPAVASVHGDLAEALLDNKLKKGATAVLDVSADGVDVLERLDPPA